MALFDLTDGVRIVVTVPELSKLGLVCMLHTHEVTGISPQSMTLLQL